MCPDHNPPINLYGAEACSDFQILCFSPRSDLRNDLHASGAQANLMNEGIVIALINTLMVKPISVSSGLKALQVFLPITQK